MSEPRTPLMTTESWISALGIGGKGVEPCLDSISWAAVRGITEPAEAWDGLCDALCQGGDDDYDKPGPVVFRNWLAWLITNAMADVKKFDAVNAVVRGVSLNNGVSVFDHIHCMPILGAVIDNISAPTHDTDAERTAEMLAETAYNAWFNTPSGKDAVAYQGWKAAAIVNELMVLRGCVRYSNISQLLADIVTIGSTAMKPGADARNRNYRELGTILKAHNPFREES